MYEMGAYFWIFFFFTFYIIGFGNCESLADCDFDILKGSTNYSSCNYELVLGLDHHCFNWHLCNGRDAHWKGGPSVDGSGITNGGYVFIDPSAMASYQAMNKSQMAWLMTPKFEATKAAGKCLIFRYNIKGLSSKTLRVLLYDMSKNSTFSIWEKQDSTLGIWKTGQVSFTSETDYQLIFEAKPNAKDPFSRGHIAVDNVKMVESACPGDCMFDADTCTWLNEDGSDDLDFDFGRGSTSSVTGPTSDHTSATREGISGGYIYLDSSYPRGPGDKALLVSKPFNATAPDEPKCMKFWISVYGTGIGPITIRLLDIQNRSVTEPIWKLTRDSFDNSVNVWQEARTTISHQAPFKVLIEAEVGETDTGDIALDDISFLDGPCPILPQIASVGNGDCSFTTEACEWTVVPIVQEANSISMWSVAHGTDTTLLQPYGHTQTTNIDTHDGYMRFWTTNYNYMHAMLDASAIVGPQVKVKNVDLCIAFWVFMYSSLKTELGIGSLSLVHINQAKNKTLWNLSGSQDSRWFFAQATFKPKMLTDKVAFIGVKGKDFPSNIAVDDVMVYSGKCATLPSKSVTHEGDCSFDLNTCSWTISDVTSENDERWTWLKPNKLNGPRQVKDHTFGIESDGFVYVEIMNAPRPIKTELRSPLLPGNQTICLSFYYTAYHVGDSVDLEVLTRGGSEKQWWNVTRKVGDATATGNTGTHWNYGQVEVKHPTEYMIIFRATIRLSGLALDDVKVKLAQKNCPSGSCCSTKNFLSMQDRILIPSSRRQGRFINLESFTEKTAPPTSTNSANQPQNDYPTISYFEPDDKYPVGTSEENLLQKFSALEDQMPFLKKFYSSIKKSIKDYYEEENA